MTDSGRCALPTAAPAAAIDPDARLDALRARGAARFDPARFRFIEALARRAASREDAVGHALKARLAAALAEFCERFERAEHDARAALAHGTARFPEAAEALRQHYEGGDFGGLHRSLARLEARGGSGPLAALLAHLAQHARGEAADGAGHAAATTGEPPSELKALRYFRSTWSKLSVDRQLSHAFAQAPDNAGPLNSHFLVLQSLELMREIAPDYLAQFISYTDALLWLDQADSSRAPAPKPGERDPGRRTGQAPSQRKSSRAKAG